MVGVIEVVEVVGVVGMVGVVGSEIIKAAPISSPFSEMHHDRGSPTPHAYSHKSRYLLGGVGLSAILERDQLRRPARWRRDRGEAAEVAGVGRDAEVQHAGRVVREVGRERVVGGADRVGRIALELA